MGTTKEKIDSQKFRGGYYTPKEIAKFISDWAIQNGTENVLEPSCGDGNFIESAILRFNELGVDETELAGRIRGVELMQEEAQKARERAANLGLNGRTIINSDFFHYVQSNEATNYDVILGNPPFIRYQSFPEEHRSIAIKMMQEMGLKPNKLTNIWVPFLVISASLLNENGKLGMVIPAELFQVKYAAETRVFLSNFFQRITIITFKKLVFKGIQQEVVILLCEKQVDESEGIRVIECENMEELEEINFERVNQEELRTVDHSTEKWTKYFLTEDEIQFMRNLRRDERITKCQEYFDVDVGIVTGRNDFFMMKDSQVREWKVTKHIQPVTSKSNQLKGVSFSEEDYRENGASGYAVNLFIPPNVEFDELSTEAKNYIKYGEEQNYHTGYKCRIRKRWYITPSLWTPDAFALRQVAGYPKIILNNSGASSTDTIHRVRFKEGVDYRTATISFLNSLSFAFSEITGRSYGGGVMTFEPTEIEEIQIPTLLDLDVDFDNIDELIREKRIEEVLDIIDEAFLIQGHGFSREEVSLLRSIWKKLSQRRLTRNKSKKKISS
ncbi:N-6 DNA methylase [Aquimarina hainanensis]|uniref:site-specific DNA-methyltransferase (adenine-specific) n=1 Tax=Aquimarina hainanensis TaxID=1578017 RepID=A0ABW5NAZ2_9FLAO